MKKRFLSLIGVITIMFSMFGNVSAANNSKRKSDCTIIFSKIGLLVNKCPYVWGGASSSGCDCSGLVWYAYHLTGPKFNLGSEQCSADIAQYLYKKNKYVSASWALDMGDLIFYDLGSRNQKKFKGIDHVSIYHQNDLIFESMPDSGVRYTKRHSKSKEVFYGDLWV